MLQPSCSALKWTNNKVPCARGHVHAYMPQDAVQAMQARRHLPSILLTYISQIKIMLERAVCDLLSRP